MIKINHLSKKYGKKIVLDNINLTLPKGKIIALVGPNGVGKTTLMNIMVNLTPADNGEVYFGNQSNQNQNIFKHVSFMLDPESLYEYMSGYDHLKYACDVYQLNKKAIEKVVKQLKMTSYIHQAVSEYSLGMRQKLLIGLAILNQPDVLIMDEPFNGLDPSAVIDLRNILQSFERAGKTVLLSAHTLSEIDMLCEHILFLKDGKIHEEILEDRILGQVEEKYKALYL